VTDSESGSGAPVRLRACDGEDLRVIAALLQDALVELGEMAFLSKEARFAAVFDRFMWEGVKKAPDLKTVKCGLCFEGVNRVKVCGIDQENRKQVLELLTIVLEEGRSEEECAIHLLFAGGGIVRLEAANVDCRVKDLGAPRPAPVRPRHPVAALA